MAEDDRYTIPGSGEVLRNKLGLTAQSDVPTMREARLSAAFRVGGEKVLADYLRAHLIESLDADPSATG